MRKFLSKAHLLKEVAQISDESDLRKFVKAVTQDSLNSCRIKPTGTLEEILGSLMPVSKAVLESAFETVYGEYEEDEEETEEEEEGEYDDDEVEEDDDDDDCDCEEE